MTYYGILSEADAIEIFPDKYIRSEVLQYYYEIEFEATKLDIPASTKEEMQTWVEKEYPGIRVEFANHHIVNLQLENHELRKRVEEIDEVVGRWVNVVFHG